MRTDDNQNTAAVGSHGTNKNKLNFLKKLFNNKIMWTAIATICGAIVIVWNIIKYVFILFSSYLLFRKTNVPVYLLMQRKNLSFTDAYVIYATIVTVLMMFTFTGFAPIKRVGRKKLLFWASIALAFLVVLNLIKVVITHGQVVIFTHFLNTFIVSYLAPLLITIAMFLAGNLNYKSDNLKFAFKWIEVALLIILFLFGASNSSYCLLDQDNRFIVADLGESYVVQDVVTDNEYLYLDTSCYSIVDSTNETVHTEFKPSSQIKAKPR